MAQMSRVVMVEDNFALYDQRIRQGLTQEVRRAGHATRNRARQIIIRDNAIITGDLWRSLGVAITDSGLVAEVYSTVEYATYVHDGTERMEARPFLDEALKVQELETQQRLARLISGGTP